MTDEGDRSEIEGCQQLRDIENEFLNHVVTATRPFTVTMTAKIRGDHVKVVA